MSAAFNSAISRFFFALSIVVLSAMLSAPNAHAAEIDLDSSLTAGQPQKLQPAKRSTLLTAQTSEEPAISTEKLSLVYGKKAVLRINNVGKSAAKWSVSNKKVVKIVKSNNATATVVAVGAGTAKVIAKVGGKNLECTISVKGKLNKTKLSMTSLANGKLTLAGASAKKWKSSNKSVVKVSGNARTCVLKPGVTDGTAVVRCKDKLGNVYECTVTVKMPNLTCRLDGSRNENLLFIGDSKWYWKQYTIRNNTGKTVVLHDNAILYYPTGSIDEYPVTILGQKNSGNYFSEDALVIPSGSTATFKGVEGLTPNKMYSSTETAFLVQIGSKDYLCSFLAYGPMRLCIPQS